KKDKTMIDRFSIAVNGDNKNRIYFFYLSDVIDYLKNDVEADANTYRLNITEWHTCAGSAASCTLQWVRTGPNTRMAELVTKTIRCENTDFLEIVHAIDTRGHVWKSYKRVEW
ncbi:MAG: hypothetical protein IKW44_04460, partial [Bacteroidaceae bacterium]|nr:hypothetical protein [Bacteroidaceae bacterium]